MKPASGLLALTFHLAIVSSISFGGFPTVLPDVHAFVVILHGWITDQDFTNIFAMAQAIPGPNMILMMGLIEWKVWGLAGALAASTATFAPPCAIYFLCFSPNASLSGTALATCTAVRAHSCDHGFDYRERHRNG